MTSKPSVAFIARKVRVRNLCGALLFSGKEAGIPPQLLSTLPEGLSTDIVRSCLHFFCVNDGNIVLSFGGVEIVDPY